MLFFYFISFAEEKTKQKTKTKIYDVIKLA